MIDVYESAVDHAGRHGAAFERDDDTAFFYLLDLVRGEASQIVEAFNAHAITEMPADVPVVLQWTAGDDAVGLFVDGRLQALFDLRNGERKGRWATHADRSLFVHH
jgi:hypothetical protein